MISYRLYNVNNKPYHISKQMYFFYKLENDAIF